MPGPSPEDQFKAALTGAVEKHRGTSAILDAASALVRHRRIADNRKRKAPKKFSRNDSCPCGSGKKFKRCHEGKPIAEYYNEK